MPSPDDNDDVSLSRAVHMCAHLPPCPHGGVMDTVCQPSDCSCRPAGQIFGWEAVISFILVSVVYAVAIGSPSFGAHKQLSRGCLSVSSCWRASILLVAVCIGCAIQLRELSCI